MRRELHDALEIVDDVVTMGTRDGMTQLVRALKDHENEVAVVAPRKQSAQTTLRPAPTLRQTG
jgi:hypothetical protein